MGGRCSRPALLLGFLLAQPLPAAAPRRAVQPWEELERRQAVIAEVTVGISDVFDLAKPEDNLWIGRVADHLHASTREPVIRRALLFKAGDRVNARIIYETERLLRALPFLKDAHILPVVRADGGVVAQVRVRDAWTTQVKASFSSVGGQRAMAMGLSEQNLLGSGKSLSLDCSKDQQRTTRGLTYLDPQVLGSRWVLGLQDQVLSDGDARTVHLDRPFYALATPWSATLGLSQKRIRLNLYDNGTPVFTAPLIQTDVQGGAGVAFHRTGSQVWRLSFLMDRQDTQYGPLAATAPPGALQAPALVDRRLRGPSLTLATQEDAYESFHDLLGMDTPEDYNLSWLAGLTVGTYSRALGSSGNVPFFRLQGTKGWSHSPDDLSLLKFNWSGRVADTGQENAQVNLALIQYLKLTQRQILAGMATVDLGRRLDAENWYYLGGEQGMRGFPNELHPGEARWVVSMDYRYLTGQRWWGLVRLGYNAFVDLGSIHLMDAQGWSRVYADVGAGLRLGNLRSSLGHTITLSVARPLNADPHLAKVQFTIGNTMQF